MIPLFEILNHDGFRFLKPATEPIELLAKGMTINGFFLCVMCMAQGNFIMLQKIDGDVVLVYIEDAMKDKLKGHHIGELISITCIEDRSLTAGDVGVLFSICGLMNAQSARKNIPNRISLEQYIPPAYVPPGE